MIDFHEAHKLMYRGHIVKYIGTINGPVWTNDGYQFCMKRGGIFALKDGEFVKNGMLYDPNFRYELTNDMTDTSEWPELPEHAKTR